MNLRNLQYFLELSKIEHVSLAAEQLYISQPSLSHAMHQLEKELGVRLFEKQGRNIVLTKYGKIYAKFVEKAFETLEHGANEIKRQVDPAYGHVDLAFFHSLGINFIPKLLRRFLSHKENERYTFSFGQGADAKILNGLANGDYDLVFCSIPNKDLMIEYTPIASQKLYVIVPENHPLATKQIISLKELNGEKFISFSQKGGLRLAIEQLLERENIMVDVVYQMEQGTSVAGLVSSGFGVAILPEIEMPVLHIKKLDILEPVPHRYIYLANSKMHYMSSATLCLKEFILQNYSI